MSHPFVQGQFSQPWLPSTPAYPPWAAPVSWNASQPWLPCPVPSAGADTDPPHLPPPPGHCPRKWLFWITGGPLRAGAPPPAPTLQSTSAARPQVFSVRVLEDWVTEEGGPGILRASFQFLGIGPKYKFGPKQSPGSRLHSWGHLWVSEAFKAA